MRHWREQPESKSGLNNKWSVLLSGPKVPGERGTCT
jgi:hypothetical protein